MGGIQQLFSCRPVLPVIGPLQSRLFHELVESLVVKARLESVLLQKEAGHLSKKRSRGPRRREGYEDEGYAKTVSSAEARP